MLKIQKLKRPNKNSGVRLSPGSRLVVRGVLVVNQNKFSVYVDKWIRSDVRKAKK